jgi:hypothetical protein
MVGRQLKGGLFDNFRKDMKVLWQIKFWIVFRNLMQKINFSKISTRGSEFCFCFGGNLVTPPPKIFKHLGRRENRRQAAPEGFQIWREQTATIYFQPGNKQGKLVLSLRSQLLVHFTLTVIL